MFSGKKFALLKIVISLASIWVLISFVNPSQVLPLLLNMNVFFVPLILIFIFLNIVLYVINYWVLLGKKLDFLSNLSDYLAMWSLGLFLPGKIGELGIIPLLKKKYRVPYKFAIAAAVVPKAAMLFVFFLFFGLLSFFSATGSSYEGPLAALFIACVALFFLRHSFSKIFKVIASKNRVALDLYNSRAELKSFFGPKNLIFAGFVAVLRFFCVAIAFYFAFLAFGFQPPLWGLLLAISLSQITAFVPVTINGLGVREATFTGIMVSFGAPLEIALVAAALSMIISYLFGIAVIVVWNIKNLRLKKK